MHLVTLTIIMAAFLASSSASMSLQQHPEGPNGVADFRTGVVTYPIPKGMGYNGPWQVYREWGGPTVVPEEGFLRFEAQKMGGVNSYRHRGRWILVDLQPRLKSAGGAVVFKLRLNHMDGLEAQLTVLANLTLRIRDKGQRVEWARWTGTEFITLAGSNLRGGDTAWHQVVILTTANGFTLLENGELLFSFEKMVGEYVPQTFHSSKMSPNTVFSLDIGDLICIPGPGASLI